jgi:Tol biopolymer transport system component
MPLQPGARLGPYEIAAQIGAGGMGEVYRATDTNLKRQVAIKVLPESLAADRERLARFQREAEVLAVLNHPNIAHIYGLEPSDGATALVMELVEGPTLADRIADGPVPVDEALAIARQIAEALDAAHGQGIVHRDLKPANVKVRDDGAVKVLDFGLAKALEPANAGASPGASMSPTITSPAMTQAGIILGTAAYMSPEQARGRTVDRRADIWAFGCVLYEMLTGARLFKGDDLTETLASVVKDQPNLDAVPPRVRRLLAKCLEKDPRKRLRDIGDAWDLLEVPTDPAAPAAATSPARRLPWIVAGMAAVAVAGLAFVYFRERPPATRPLRLAVPLAQERATSLALSPDGRRLVIAVAQNRDRELYLRSLDSGDLHTLAGTRGARQPFWSADSRFVGFFADDALKVIPAAGGPVQILCRDTGRGLGGAWNGQGVILFASVDGPLRRVNANGGECRGVGTGNPAAPAFLPDGDHFLYTEQDGVHLATLEEPAGRTVLADHSGAVYTSPAAAGAPAHLLFLREDKLMAQPFDERSLQPIGDPFVVAAPASRANEAQLVAASAAADGTLAYLSGGSEAPSQLTWFDRAGKAVETIGPPGLTAGAAVTLSPDGTRVLYDRQLAGEKSSGWLWDLARGSNERLTAAGSSFDTGIWSADSERIWFRLFEPDGGWYQKDLSSGAQTPVLPGDGRVRILSDWSRDGRFVIFTDVDAKSQGDVWSAPVEAGRVNIGAAVNVVGTDATESQGQLSPDGRWLAYTSDEADHRLSSVYLRPFPNGDTVKRVSPPGATQPRWRADGKELFFMALEPPDVGRLTAVSVEPDASAGLRVGVPHELFATRIRFIFTTDNVFSYSPDHGGQRFLVNVLASEGQPIVNVITDWQRAIPAPSTAPR